LSNVEFHLFSEDGKEQVQKVQLKQRILMDSDGETMGWQVNPFRDVYCTMGVKELADKNEAWWLLDHITFAQDDEKVKPLVTAQPTPLSA
jgi:hypothetical protein